MLPKHLSRSEDEKLPMTPEPARSRTPVGEESRDFNDASLETASPAGPLVSAPPAGHDTPSTVDDVILQLREMNPVVARRQIRRLVLVARGLLSIDPAEHLDVNKLLLGILGGTTEKRSREQLHSLLSRASVISSQYVSNFFFL